MNAKHASNTLTLVETPTQTTCQPFCLRHDPLEEDLCIGPAIELNFGEQTQDTVSYVRISGSARTGSGDITIDMAGAVTARTGSGDIRLSRSAGPASLSTGSGDVSAPESADVHTGSGRIRRIGAGR